MYRGSLDIPSYFQDDTESRPIWVHCECGEVYSLDDAQDVRPDEAQCSCGRWNKY